MAFMNLHFRLTAVIFRLHHAKNESKKLLVLHPGLFSNLAVKRYLKPVRSASSLQGCFMSYQIDIVHWIISNVVCCIFRALYILNEGFIPWINLYLGNCMISANMIMSHSDSWPFWRSGNQACSSVKDGKNMNGYSQVISFS